VKREHLRSQEIWIAWIRLLAVALTVVLVVIGAYVQDDVNATQAWLLTALFAAGSVVLALLARRDWGERELRALGLSALAFDVAVIYVYAFSHTLTTGTQSTRLAVLVVAEAAVRYGIVGGVGLTLANLPLLALVELERAAEAAPPNDSFQARNVAITLFAELLTGLIVGGLVRQLRHATATAEARAAEAEALRDEIGRHADQLETVNRCARALSSSLELDEAFRGFVQEVRSALPFDRLALILAEGGRARVIADAGLGREEPAELTWVRPLGETVLGQLVQDGATVVSDDMAESPRYPEELEIAGLGLRSRVVAPLSLAGRTLGAISVSRIDPAAFSPDEVHLVTMLGRQLATAVENIRAFEAERAAGEELRRLSALRADFVSLVSHELRGPMASVVGCASTLRQRWRTLTPDQRESFLALIDEETTRLAALIGDVLDTSRVEAGTFTYSFTDVDLAVLLEETASVVDLGTDDVSVRTTVPTPLPSIRGDRERLRQLVMNLLTNAVKYTVDGDEIEVRADASDGMVEVSVSDNGPGISAEEQRIIFEKFGRGSHHGSSTPGAGLGLFIARSIAEAHGGSLRVASRPGEGATFTVRLPAARATR
jgi:signal transduction histidine kinase